ncbi:hypothetical protein Pelo_12548 [Pelomyxa schiedti]|nr:hypothetical protein Pelo_12548 [Pelomyxa schiedti]
MQQATVQTHKSPTRGAQQQQLPVAEHVPQCIPAVPLVVWGECRVVGGAGGREAVPLVHQAAVPVPVPPGPLRRGGERHRRALPLPLRLRPRARPPGHPGPRLPASVLLRAHRLALPHAAAEVPAPIPVPTPVPVPARGTASSHAAASPPVPVAALLPLHIVHTSGNNHWSTPRHQPGVSGYHAKPITVLHELDRHPTIRTVFARTTAGTGCRRHTKRTTSRPDVADPWAEFMLSNDDEDPPPSQSQSKPKTSVSGMTPTQPMMNNTTTTGGASQPAHKTHSTTTVPNDEDQEEDDPELWGSLPPPPVLCNTRRTREGKDNASAHKSH